ncbi:MAG: Gmad2 immunoglobulin-like domain-containing protein, partial [Candidatus Latescibacterota bacterium]
IVRSPLLVEGEARGTWYFEATFPLRLLDGSGNELAVGYAQAEGEWMTENFVPFRGRLEFATPRTDTGTLILERANPSGLPEHAREMRAPVRFR